MSRTVRLAHLTTLSAALLLAPAALADLPRSPEIGTVGADQALGRLPVTARFLLVGAHPDDEPSGVMAYVGRGLHAETAYLSLNRGEGGQNEIGPELFDGLGVIRTDELLGARALDGAKQYFTTVYDFGYSRTLEETLSKWDEQKALEDVVKVIRTFRPDVMVTFHADERVGHGHHQAAGYLAVKAFELAGDPKAFPELGLPAWQPSKLYLSAGVGGGAGEADKATLTIDVGQYDPVIGRSYQQVGLEGRSFHRSQGMGQVQPPGSYLNHFVLLESKLGAKPARETSFFDGIATALPERWKGVNAALEADLAAVQKAADTAAAKLDARQPQTALPDVLAGLTATRAALSKVQALDLEAARKAALIDDLNRKAAQFTDAAQRLAGIDFRAVPTKATVAQGETATVRWSLTNQGGVPLELLEARIAAPSSWKVEGAAAKTGPVEQGKAASGELKVTLPADANLTRPYWRRPDAFSGRVQVERPECVTLPHCPPDATAHARVRIGGVELDLEAPLAFVWSDAKFGERSRLLTVTPKLSVSAAPELKILPLGSERNVAVQVRVSSHSASPVAGKLSLQLPQGWTSAQGTQDFRLERENDSRLITFTAVAPEGLQAGRYAISAVAEVDGRRYTEGMQLVSYPHTEYRALYNPARVEVQAFDLAAPKDLKVGYVPGVGDQVPAALEQAGLQVTLLTPEFIASGDLSQYDTIVVGVRAYNDRPDLVAHHARLMKYVEDGGNMVVQYHKFEWDKVLPGGPGPFPTTMSTDRVTEEDAPVKILVPEDPDFNTPNRITAADFDGWVQERGLYWLSKWDDRYVPLLASNDKGLPELKGGLLKAKVGKGTWTYAGYAFFRELPAGVPGAYRLFVNLLTPDN
ncbi:LmbE family N-acetylglucosaminyl deacetylase [Deinobacterium chartae]|uniref:LmbE family N-acetylglucosaminyl deacetylase n=1 Tax=Deinobacterium chartae TaxID=521158 RepID=A0A841HZY4_9DEIO|nr:PIG-L family deacetylase [Deinobacterium chartae]MBB6098426.1 LmbE family N-acetylglucosaminyl deacetylase [Deinobacterium chartae]